MCDTLVNLKKLILIAFAIFCYQFQALVKKIVFLPCLFFFIHRLNTHKELYETLKKVSVHGDVVPLDELDKHVVDLFLFDFEQSGIHLDEEARKSVVYLNDCVLRLGQRFMAGALTPRTVSGNSLPDSVKK